MRTRPRTAILFFLVVNPFLLSGCPTTGGSTATGPAEVTTSSLPVPGAPATDEKANPTVADAADAPPHPGGVAAPTAEPDPQMTTGLRVEGSFDKLCREPGSGFVRLALSGKLTSRETEDAPWVPCEACEGMLLRFVDDHSSWEKHLDQYADTLISSQGLFDILFITTKGDLPGLYYLGVKILPEYFGLGGKKLGEQYPCGGVCLPPLEGIKTVKLEFSLKNPKESLPDCPITLKKFIDVNP